MTGEQLAVNALLFSIGEAPPAEDAAASVIRTAANMAAAVDRRAAEQAAGAGKATPLFSIFNRLNKNDGQMVYRPEVLSPAKINYPENGGGVSASVDNLYDGFEQAFDDWQAGGQDVNALLRLTEEYFSYAPAAPGSDIALYDTARMTANLAVCIAACLKENKTPGADTPVYDVPFFLLFSMDMSGIQPFIYQQYENKDVLKNLRARSFYLDIMMENAIDDLLDGLGLTRVNVIYAGGGHAYMLLPNTKSAKAKIAQFEDQINRWMRSFFQADLYLACGYAPCTANNMRNVPDGSYSDMFSRVSNALSEKKLHRYTAADIIEMNHIAPDAEGRECRVCHRSDHLTQDNLCEVCDGLIHLSRGILDNDYFTVVSEKQSGTELPLGENRYLVTDRFQSAKHVVRTYVKNVMGTGELQATKLWVGDYCAAPTLSELAQNGAGISRLGVLRADVDNLGQAFVRGFDEAGAQSLSRSAVFSRDMSLFFKMYINHILKNAEYVLGGKGEPSRNVAIVYSGGDDIFVVGAWKDVLEFAVDLYNAVVKFSQEKLTFSGGFGIYDPKYPIAYMAEQTGDLEDFAKDLSGETKDDPGKNAVALFDETGRYRWPVFIKKVLDEKFKIIYDYFEGDLEAGQAASGKAFLYHILDFFRKRDEKINLARLAYTLARLEPPKNADDKKKGAYARFKKQLYEWMKSDEDSRQAITAIYLYIYLIREDEEEQA